MPYSLGSNCTDIVQEKSIAHSEVNFGEGKRKSYPDILDLSSELSHVILKQKQKKVDSLRFEMKIRFFHMEDHMKADTNIEKETNRVLTLNKTREPLHGHHLQSYGLLYCLFLKFKIYPG